MKVVLKKKTNNRQLYLLGGLVALAAYLLWPSGADQTAASPRAPATQTQEVAPAAAAPITGAPVQRRGLTARGSTEFRPYVPKQNPNRPEDRIDPNQIDPTLRLDILAKVQAVSLSGGSRNLFQFGVAAPVVPLTPLPKAPKVVLNQPPPSPQAPPRDPGPPPPPQAPPIPLKYYGFTNTRGELRKKAFFLDGEDIIVAWEGETVKSRYRIVRIGVSSIEMEDVQFKSRQTLPLEPEATG